MGQIDVLRALEAHFEFFCTVAAPDEMCVRVDETGHDDHAGGLGADRVDIEPLGHDCYRLMMNFGFMERPDIMKALEACEERGLQCKVMETSFFLSRESIIPNIRQHGMALWRERLFAAMARNAGSAVEYFNLPTNRVIELGTQIEI